MLKAVDGGAVVDVPPAPPPPPAPPAPPPPAPSPPQNPSGTGSISAALQGTTTSGPAPTGTAGSLNVPTSEGGTATTITTPSGGTVAAPPAPTAPPGTDSGEGSAASDLTFAPLDLESFNDSLRKPQGIGQLWNTMWKTIWTRPPAVHTKIQGLNDGTQDLFKTTPKIG